MTDLIFFKFNSRIRNELKQTRAREVQSARTLAGSCSTADYVLKLQYSIKRS